MFTKHPSPDLGPSAEAIAAAAELTLMGRLSVGIHGVGLSSWEYSYTEQRFTWLDRLPSGAELRESQAELELRAFLDSILPEDRIRWHDVGWNALNAGEESITLVLRRQDANGNIRHAQVYQRFFCDENGKPVRVICATRDVTDEVVARETLTLQAEHLKNQQGRIDRAMRSIEEGHWEYNLATQKNWFSPSLLALLGYSEDSTGFDNHHVSLVESIHPNDVYLLEAGARQVGTLDLALRLRTKDGSYRWFRVRRSAAIETADGPVFTGSVSDIHQQRVAEDALREAQARFTRATQGTQDGLWELDQSTGATWLSPRLHELLGFEDGELGNNAGSLAARVHPDDAALVERAARSAITESVLIDVELRMRKKSGEYGWFCMRGAPIADSPGQVRYIAGSMRDVTDVRRAREAVRESSEAAHAANRAKSEFLANVSHEIRTPMNGVFGMTRLLLDTNLDATQREFADTIRTSADSLLTIINDILDFSKIEAGKLEIEFLEMDLPANLEKVGAVMAFQAAPKGVELILNSHPDVPRYVLGDPQRIRQCLINLIGNAIKFTPSGEIVCEIDVVSGNAEESRLRFSVRDTGIGIDPDTLKSLFEPFVQADSSTTRHFGGTGLGLSIVRRLAVMMGGETGVESRLGKGSTFWFELPMKCVAAPAGDFVPVRSGLGHRVLVVDDNETNRRVLLSQLAHAGYDVTLASSGSEALATMRSALAKAELFDVVLIDFQMPDMDGAMLREAINLDPHLSKARAFLLTSMDRRGDLDRFATLGFAGYLQKPVRPKELFSCLDRVLSRESEDWHTCTHPIITLNAVRQGVRPPALSGTVLLVEDNLVNQKVARKFLERMGCKVVVAENGREGVRIFGEDSFCLVLMDVQMPIMDGYAATAAIRAREVGTPHTPIIALTANAMSGQLERCLQAGMDGLLTKPLDVDQLEAMLLRFGLGSAPEPSPEEVPCSLEAPMTAGCPARAAAVDTTALQALAGGDAEFLAELIRSYLDSSRDLLAEINACSARGDRTSLSRMLHQLAGASANVHAPALRQLCTELERAVPGAPVPRIAAGIADITRELGRVDESFAALSCGLADAV